MKYVTRGRREQGMRDSPPRMPPGRRCTVGSQRSRRCCSRAPCNRTRNKSAMEGPIRNGQQAQKQIRNNVSRFTAPSEHSKCTTTKRNKNKNKKRSVRETLESANGTSSCPSPYGPNSLFFGLLLYSPRCRYPSPPKMRCPRKAWSCRLCRPQHRSRRVPLESVTQGERPEKHRATVVRFLCLMRVSYAGTRSLPPPLKTKTAINSTCSS